MDRKKMEGGSGEGEEGKGVQNRIVVKEMDS